jgi:hypothetical protein
VHVLEKRPTKCDLVITLAPFLSLVYVRTNSLILHLPCLAEIDSGSSHYRRLLGRANGKAAGGKQPKKPKGRVNGKAPPKPTPKVAGGKQPTPPKGRVNGKAPPKPTPPNGRGNGKAPPKAPKCALKKNYCSNNGVISDCANKLCEWIYQWQNAMLLF